MIWCLWAYWQSNIATWTQSANVGQYSIVHSAHTGQPQLYERLQTALRSQVYDELIGQPGWRTPPLYRECGACTVGLGSLRVTLGSTFVGWQSYRPVLSWDLALRWQCQFRSQCTLLFSLHNCTCWLSTALHIHLALLHCSGQIGSSTVQQVWTLANHLSQSKGQTQWLVLLYSSGTATVAIPILYSRLWLTTQAGQFGHMHLARFPVVSHG